MNRQRIKLAGTLGLLAAMFFVGRGAAMLREDLPPNLLPTTRSQRRPITGGLASVQMEPNLPEMLRRMN